MNNTILRSAADRIQFEAGHLKQGANERVVQPVKRFLGKLASGFVAVDQYPVDLPSPVDEQFGETQAATDASQPTE
jgi:hypothetical protein